MEQVIYFSSFDFADFFSLTPLATAPSDDFAIDEFAAWARTKPADELYTFSDENNCALAQFGIATGRAHLVGAQGTALLYRRPELYRLLRSAGTFGTLALRLEAHAAAQKAEAARAVAGEPPHFTQRREGYAADGRSQWVKPEAYMADIELAVS